MSATTESCNMLHVWLPSGEEAACVSISHADRVQQLKQRLHMLLRVSRFLQRIVHGNLILDDDAQLASITDVQLVVLPFLSTSEQGAHNFLRAVRENSHVLVVSMLQMQHDPNTAAHSRNEHLTPIETAAKEGHTGMVSLLLEAGAQDAFDADQVALAAASRAGHREVVSLLLEAGGDRDCALQAASWAGQVQVVRMLLERPGAYELTTRGYSESLVAASATLNQGILFLLLEADGLGFFDVGWPRAVLGGLMAGCKVICNRVVGVFLTTWCVLWFCDWCRAVSMQGKKEATALVVAGIAIFILLAIPFKLLFLLLASWVVALRKAVYLALNDPKPKRLYKRRDYDGFCALLHVFAARAVWPEEIAANDWVGRLSHKASILVSPSAVFASVSGTLWDFCGFFVEYV
ncbi:Ankyrin repeat and KH domain-containing protein mask [Symbiodinium microadriaticum]|uniref:Ankyrin repeat and KH domain-containing protein mask n=1 Tax=Symbiodinium microadriaticum TaxID=2951 RepID=A0A1Q9E0G1_SYMMI|nr:Ankyrin repeat and KH domain-containing protein mask [Symbiodinium microadriaticum]CAE7943968.1 mask [Symbiodinium sp. KB8]